jgi:hypothetical protein
VTFRHRRREGRSEDGFVPIEYVLGIGLLVLPVGLLVITLPEWPSRTGVARQAATEAARNAIEQSDWPHATAAGAAAAQEVVTNYGLDPTTLSVSFTGSVGRGGVVTAHVGIAMPAMDVPVFGTVGTWTWTVDHSEKVDQYRSYP